MRVIIALVVVYETGFGVVVFAEEAEWVSGGVVAGQFRYHPKRRIFVVGDYCSFAVGQFGYVFVRVGVVEIGFVFCKVEGRKWDIKADALRLPSVAM